MLSFFPTASHITVDTTFELIRQLGVKISRSTWSRELQEHPFFPSLLSVSDVLKTFGIGNFAAKFSTQCIPDLPTPFLVQIHIRQRKYFSIVTRRINGIIDYYEPIKKRWVQVDELVFIDMWTGVALLPNLTETAGEAEYQQMVGKEKRRLFLLYAVILAFPAILVLQAVDGYFKHGTSIVLPFLFSLFLLFGVYISALLFLRDVFKNDSIIRVVCKMSKKVNCGKVLDSDGAKILGVSWSLVGLAYFTGALTYSLVHGISSVEVYNALAWMNFIAMLFIPYSIFYQWKVAKAWCQLCLAVQGLVVSIGVLSVFGGLSSLSTLALIDILTLSAVFILPFITSVFLYNLSATLFSDRAMLLDLQRQRRNPEVITKVLQEQKHFKNNPSHLGIILGNSSANNIIVKVCNPFCGPCSLVHEDLKELLSRSQDLAIQIIFTATNEANDMRTLPVKHFLALYEQGGDVERALGDWHGLSDKDYSRFASMHPIDECSLKRQEEKVDDMRRWCEQENISFTPTFFVNGRTLPSSYNVKDLKYMFFQN